MAHYCPVCGVQEASYEEVQVFEDMFELFPIHSCVHDLPPMPMRLCSNGDVLTDTWYSSLRREGVNK